MTMKMFLLAGLLAAASLQPIGAQALPAPREITYKSTATGDLQLSLHLPAVAARGPRALVVWVHGGSWSRGSKDDLPSSNPHLYSALLQQGYAIASVGYRLSGEARFPAPVQDINDAVNFLHDHGREYGVDGSAVVMAGRSAGGHLASLVGLINGHGTPSFAKPALYKVKGIVSFFGPADLLISEGKHSMSPERLARSPTARMLGDVPADNPALARQASPITYVGRQSAPTLLLHGRKDVQVPLAHSIALQQALKAQGVETDLRIEDDAAHSAKVFDSAAHVPAVVAFVQRHLPGPTQPQPY